MRGLSAKTEKGRIIKKKLKNAKKWAKNAQKRQKALKNGQKSSKKAFFNFITGPVCLPNGLWVRTVVRFCIY